MRPISQTPLLARLPAIILGLLLSASVLFAHAQTLPEVQRLMKQNQMPQALEKVDLYISTKPKDAQGLFLRGLILTEMGRSVDAIAVVTKLTEDYPELPEPYNNLAVLYAQQKQYDKARTALEMAIRTHPSYSIAHENLGDVYAKLASQAYSKALQLDAGNAGVAPKLSLIRNLFAADAKGAKPAAAPAVATPPVAAAKPAASAPAAAPAAQAPAATGNAESDVESAVAAWAKAWSSKNMSGYLGAYAGNFTPPGGQSRSEWEADRKARIMPRNRIDVDISELSVSVNGDRASAKFRQAYSSDSLSVTSRKTLDLVRSGNRWLIVRESTGS